MNEKLEEYLTKISLIPLIVYDEANDLGMIARRGGSESKAAKDKLYHTHLRVVVTLAMQYQNRGMSLADLIDWGNTGLRHAIDNFDPSRGYRFVSYATWWIRQTILLALAKENAPSCVDAVSE